MGSVSGSSGSAQTRKAGGRSDTESVQRAEHQDFLDLLHQYQKRPDAWQGTYEEALAEIRNGEKEGHWIWYVLPQTVLGNSRMSQLFQIKPDKCLDIAEAILDDQVLGKNFVDILLALQALEGEATIREILGSEVDTKKLLSCLTLFSKTRKSQAGKIEAEKTMKIWFPDEVCTSQSCIGGT